MRHVLFAIALLVVVVGAIVGVKWAQVSALVRAGEVAERAGPPPEAVSTGHARSMRWQRSLSAVGTVAAVRGVAVGNDLPGVVREIHFESGETVEAGEVLVELDASVESAQLRTALAEQKLARREHARNRELFERGGIASSQLEQTEARFASASAEVSRLRAQIARKQVRAPFAGQLGIRAVNLGQYLAPGTTITTLEALQSVFVDFSVPQQFLDQLRPGLTVRASIAGEAGRTFRGEIAAIDPRLDEATRAVQARARVPNADQRLRPGMFVNVEVALPGETRVTAVPVTAVVRAPYGDSVFVVAPLAQPAGGASKAPRSGGPDARVEQRFVQLGEQRGDFVAVLEGLDPGQEVVTAGAFKLQTGARVVVAEGVEPRPELRPQPENR